MVRLAARLTDRVVIVTAEMREAVERHLRVDGDRVVVIENGADLGRYLAIRRQPPACNIVFGAVGRLTVVKNHRSLIDAFALVRHDRPQARVRILGSGPLEHELRQHARERGVDDAVEFCGFSPDVPGFLSEVDVFVLPSRSEGLPLSLLEAMAAGLPAVATRVGAVPRLVTASGAGWLCEPDDTPGLARALDAAIAAPDRLARGQRARAFAAERYSFDRMASEYGQLYEAMLRRRAVAA